MIIMFVNVQMSCTVKSLKFFFHTLSTSKVHHGLINVCLVSEGTNFAICEDVHTLDPPHPADILKMSLRSYLHSNIKVHLREFIKYVT